jgi:adenylate cyclase
VIRQQDGRWMVGEDLSALRDELPRSIMSLIQRKLAAVDEPDRRLLTAASVQGSDFDSAIVARALGLDEQDVEDRLERLEREHALVRFVDEQECQDRSLTLRYRFAHHLYHNTIYDSLRITRRVALSRAVAEALIARISGAQCDCAADIALMLEAARDNVRAAEYWNRAAQAAARLYAHAETVRLAQRGLALLKSEPDTPERAAAELDLQMTCGLAIKTSQGYAVAAVGEAYARARELCRKVEDPARVVPVLIGLSAHHIVSGEIRTAHEIAFEMLDLFERIGDPHLQMIGEWSAGVAQFHRGELEDSHERLGRALALYDPSFHRPRVWQTGIEPGIFCRAEYSRTLTLRGFPDQGLACVQQAVADARALDHPQPLAFALLFEIFAHLARRNSREVQRTYDQLAVVCHAHGIAQEVQWAAPLCGRAYIDLGDTQRGLRVIQEGLATHAVSRSALLRPYYFVMFAGALMRSGHFDRAQQALDEAAQLAEATGQFAYEAEHARLQAELISARGDAPDRAEEMYRSALGIAERQGARWLELRAARGYAHFLVSRGRPADARAVLAPILAWLKEGFTTLDYVYADALFRTL